MYPDDGIYFNSGRYEERRIDISGGIGDVTRKRLLEKRASNRRNRPRECLVTLFDTRPSKLHGRAVASYPSRVTINMHINTQPSYNPVATLRAVFSSRKLREMLSKIPSKFHQRDGRGSTLVYRRYSNLVFPSSGHEANVGIKINSRVLSFAIILFQATSSKEEITLTSSGT